MGIDMSRPPSSNQQICQEGHMLIHMKMDFITREDGQQTLTLRCSLCDSVLRMSDVSRSPLLNYPVVTAAGQTWLDSQETNQTDSNTLQRESSSTDFSQDFVKTDTDSFSRHCEDDLDLDMHVECYESFQSSNENCTNIVKYDHFVSEEEMLYSKTIDRSITPQCTDAVPNRAEKTNEKEITSTVDRQGSHPRNMESFLKRKISKRPNSVEQIPKKNPKLQANRETISVSLESSNQLSDSNENCSSSGQHTVSVQMSSSKERLKIPTCKFCFATHSEFGRSLVCGHKCPTTNTTIFICSVCNEYYSSCSVVIECERKHRQINAPSSKEEFKCIVCDKTFADFGETRQHETCHILTDSGLTAGTSFLHEASSISGSGRPEPDNQNSHISQAVTSSTSFIDNSQVPLAPQAVQFSPLGITGHELEQIKYESPDAKGFCVKLMSKIFSRAERMQNDKNVLGMENVAVKKTAFCPIRIQFIKDCVQNMYPTDFQNNTQKMWNRCVTAMNKANRNLRSWNKKQLSSDSTE